MTSSRIGFIGLGVMGEPICRNMLTKSAADFRVFDLAAAPVERLVAKGARAAGSIADAVTEAEIVFLSLPGGREVEAVVAGERGVLASGHAGQIVVDLSTAPVDLTRRLHATLAEREMTFVDAPVARTRQAAEDGTLSIMVGAEEQVFADVEPWLRHAASDVTLCGPVGCGQVLKILNNMVLFETVVALSEALAMGEKAGVDRRRLFETLSKGSADSFALRNHGMKAMVPDTFPTGAFPTDYAIKDVSYALALAEDVGVDAQGAKLAANLLDRTSKAGYGRDYFPVLSRLVAGHVE